MSPAVVVASSSPGSSKDAAKPTRRAESAHTQSRMGKTRVVRRRGRGRMGGIDSDEEIERDVMSDASDSDEPSLIDSASDSEAESETESLVLRNGRRHPDTPSTTQSPPPGEIEAAAAFNGFAASKPDSDAVDVLQPPRSAPAFLSAGVNWSDMVTDEGVNGAAALPVIDFADLHEHAGGEPPHLTKQEDASGSVASGDEKENDDASSQQGTEQPLRGAPRPHGHSARQAYQHRLQTDPSFVPTVGEFWGHDDRLMQKDLRSLSGWWRGRWQGRGRGRGGFVGRGMRGRGRGEFFGGPGPAPNEGEDTAQAEPSNADEEVLQPESEVPPIDKAWTHDGFEEMRVRDARRRTTGQRGAKPYNRPAPPNGTATAPSRGGFTPRGRGAFRGASSPTQARSSSFIAQRLRSQPDRPWYAMKPEHGWTKQFEGFLYSEPSLRPKHGKPAGFRVSLPGKGSEIVRVPAPQKTEVFVELRSQPPSEGAAVTDVGSKAIIVKMPKPSAGKATSQAEVPVVQPEPVTTVEDLPEDVPTAALAVKPLPVAQSAVADAGPSEPEQPTTASQPAAQGNVMATPSLTRDNSLSDRSVADVSGITDQTATLTLEDGKPVPEMVPVGPAPMPPPIQTAFPPPVQPTPTYASSPYAYPPSLPPGIAFNQQGFAYDVVSGRAVYMHPTPPPPPMHIYNPRPMPFVPGHMHHHSLSGDFVQAPSTPPLNGIVDPSTGQPLFSLPRQNSRIEIRAPGDTSDGQIRIKQERRPSSLRSTTVAEPNGGTQPPPPGLMPPGLARYASAHEYYPPEMMGGMVSQSSYQPSEGAASMSPGSEEPPLVQQPQMDPGMMGYPPYHQQYYYPEQFYPAYVEIPQQPGQYDPYVADPRHQPPVYY